MSMIETAVMRSCKNYFEQGYLHATFTVSDGKLSTGAMTLSAGMWVGIECSMYHNGVWQLGENNTLTGCPSAVDEEFNGRLWFLAPPPDFLQLCADIKTYQTSNPAKGMKSESFGEYSYTRSGETGGGWAEVFDSQLRPFRHMFTEVCI